MVTPSILAFLAAHGLRSFADWAHRAGLKPDVVHQARHRKRIAEPHVIALARAIDSDVATVRAVVCAASDDGGMLVRVVEAPRRHSLQPRRRHVA